MSPTADPVRAPGPTYRHEHWYFLASLVPIIGGFWPSFFRPLGSSDFSHTLHGATATLWIVALAVQSWLMARGKVRQHRKFSRWALALLFLLVLSALQMVSAMFDNAEMPPSLPPLLAFIDLTSIGFLVLLVTLALRHTRTPAAHKRFMAATVLLAFPPALTRLYAILGAPALDFMTALHLSFVTVELVLVSLLVADRRAGERQLAHPLSLAFFASVHALMLPVGTSAAWGAIARWYADIPLFN